MKSIDHKWVIIVVNKMAKYNIFEIKIFLLNDFRHPSIKCCFSTKYISKLIYKYRSKYICSTRSVPIKMQPTFISSRRATSGGVWTSPATPNLLVSNSRYWWNALVPAQRVFASNDIFEMVAIFLLLKMAERIEQRIYIKFSFNLAKRCAETN